MTREQQLAEAASGCLGIPFRLHGRDPRIGLDCVGLVAVSLVAVGAQPSIPTGYALRNRSIDPWLICADHCSLAPASGTPQAGDILLFHTGPCQQHLAIAWNASTIIHAHAGLRRVVRQPLDRSFRIQAHWRLTS